MGGGKEKGGKKLLSLQAEFKGKIERPGIDVSEINLTLILKLFKVIDNQRDCVCGGSCGALILVKTRIHKYI